MERRQKNLSAPPGRRPAGWGLFAVLLSAALAAAEPADELHFNRQAEQGALLLGQVPPGSRVDFAGQILPVTADGRFLLGFDRDAGAAETLIVTLPGGRRFEQSLQVLERQYRTDHVDGVPPETVTPPPEVQERIRREAALVAAARQRMDARADWAAGFIWPAAGRLSGEYGSQRVYNGVPARPHYGVDIAAPVGDVAFAPAAGLVTLAEPDLYFSGGTVIIDHGHGLTSTLMHLSRVRVTAGEWVNQGQTIGLIGAGGRANGPHLDWRMNWRGRRVDPASLFAAGALPPARVVATAEE